MLAWLSKLQEPETLAILGGCGLAAGYIISNFLKGFREIPKRAASNTIAPATSPTAIHLDNLEDAIDTLTRIQREILEEIRTTRARQSSELQELEAQGRAMQRIEEIAERQVGLHREQARYLETMISILVQIRDHLKGRPLNGNAERPYIHPKD